MKGLNILASLPSATIGMVLQTTPANADEANMQLEDFAKLNEGSTNVDKALSSRSKDM
jgi:cytidylate kinase